MRQIIKNIFFIFIAFFTLFTGQVSCKVGSKIQKKTTKKWNFLVYIAANNNLHKYALRNVKQMEKIGSNQNINIFAQIDNFGKRELSRYKIEKGNSKLIAKITTPPESMSGTKESLFEFAKEVISNNPTDYTAIILLNHGTGIKDPNLWTRSHPFYRDICFCFNNETNMYEINKKVCKGIAFNEFSHTYLTNHDLQITLERIKSEILGGKKIDFLGMDACYMAMVEIGSLAKNSARYMSASQQVEPGAGWDYEKILQPLKTKTLSPAELAKHVVDAYGDTYNKYFSCLTHSAIDLSNFESIEKNIDNLSIILLEIIKNPQYSNLYNTLLKIRINKATTTSFLDPDYIDLTQFYENLHQSITPNRSNKKNYAILNRLENATTEGLKLIQKSIVKNSTGTNATTAHGISIYFPTKSVDTSYFKSDFSQKTNWCNFIFHFIRKNRSTNQAYH